MRQKNGFMSLIKRFQPVKDKREIDAKYIQGLTGGKMLRWDKRKKEKGLRRERLHNKMKLKLSIIQMGERNTEIANLFRGLEHLLIETKFPKKNPLNFRKKH